MGFSSVFSIWSFLSLLQFILHFFKNVLVFFEFSFSSHFLVKKSLFLLVFLYRGGSGSALSGWGWPFVLGVGVGQVCVVISTILIV